MGIRVDPLLRLQLIDLLLLVVAMSLDAGATILILASSVPPRAVDPLYRALIRQADDQACNTAVGPVLFNASSISGEKMEHIPRARLPSSRACDVITFILALSLNLPRALRS